MLIISLQLLTPILQCIPAQLCYSNEDMTPHNSLSCCFSVANRYVAVADCCAYIEADSTDRHTLAPGHTLAGHDGACFSPKSTLCHTWDTQTGVPCLSGDAYATECGAPFLALSRVAGRRTLDCSPWLCLPEAAVAVDFCSVSDPLLPRRQDIRSFPPYRSAET